MPYLPPADVDRQYIQNAQDRYRTGTTNPMAPRGVPGTTGGSTLGPLGTAAATMALPYAAKYGWQGLQAGYNALTTPAATTPSTIGATPLPANYGLAPAADAVPASSANLAGPTAGPSMLGGQAATAPGVGGGIAQASEPALNGIAGTSIAGADTAGLAGSAAADVAAPLASSTVGSTIGGGALASTIAPEVASTVAPAIVSGVGGAAAASGAEVALDAALTAELGADVGAGVGVGALGLLALAARGGRIHGQGYAAGGLTHGLISSPTPGRADAVPTHVLADSYIMPADVVSGVGQGNTHAGAARFNHFQQVAPKHPGNYAAGGAVPVRLSGGEFAIHPSVVRGLGHGSAEAGAKLLDQYVVRVRHNIANQMKNLPPPKR